MIPWHNAATAMAYFEKKDQPESGKVDVTRCKPGSMIRDIRMDEVHQLAEAFKSQGLLKKPIIVVDFGDDGGYRLVVDGMHRVMACLLLHNAGYVSESGENFQYVSLTLLSPIRVVSSCLPLFFALQFWATVLKADTPISAMLCIAFGKLPYMHSTFHESFSSSRLLISAISGHPVTMTDQNLKTSKTLNHDTNENSTTP